MPVEIRMTAEVNLKNHVLIEGFPGIGLVGTIAAGYIAEKRKMKPVGFIYSEKFPPMTSIHNGIAYYPARIYKDPKSDFLAVFSEFVIPGDVVFELSKAILSFAKKKGIREIVSLAGMTSGKPSKEKKVYGIASQEGLVKYLASKGIEIVKEGVTTGVSGVLLAECRAENFPAFTLLAESELNYPDPRASVLLVKKLEEVIGLKVDVKELIKEAEMIETKMRKLMNQMKKGKATYKKAEESLPMYG